MRSAARPSQSGGRAGFLTLMAMGVVVMIERIRKGDTLSVLGVIGLAVCLVVISPAGYGNRIYSIVDFDADPTGSARGRYEGMFQAVEMIAERPVLGYGLGMNGLGVVERGGGWSVVHNAFLQVGTDLGVAGMIVFVLIFIQLLRGVNATIKELRLRSGNADLLALASGVRLALLAYLVGAFFHPAAYHFYFFYSAGLAVAVQNLARVLSTGPESPARRPRGALGADPRRRWIIPTSPVQAKSTLR